MTRILFCLGLLAGPWVWAAEPAAAPGVRIPVDLQDAVGSLAEIIPEGDIAEFKQPDRAAGLEGTLGVAIRSRWNLWQPSPLVEYFHAKGVQHPDHMSGIILQAWMDVDAGRKIDEAALFRYFPSWLNGQSDLQLDGTLAQVLAQLRVRATAIAREHFEDRQAVVVFTHAFDPAKAEMPVQANVGTQRYQDALAAICAQAHLRFVVISPCEIRLMDAAP